LCEGVYGRLAVPELFLGTIIIPIVGNAAEHAAAIIFAAKNKMELSLGIAVGSATQIALFVVPLTVVIAWGIDTPLSLDFHPFETATLLVTVILVGFITQVQWSRAPCFGTSSFGQQGQWAVLFHMLVTFTLPRPAPSPEPNLKPETRPEPPSDLTPVCPIWRLTPHLLPSLAPFPTRAT
jgi:hypothetical protein